MWDSSWLEASLMPEDARLVQSDIKPEDVRYGQLLILAIGLPLVVVGYAAWWAGKWLLGC
ncbi:hypothetical protein V1282_001471 [Nitrobacteraceae bacterium AZCC 2146]